MKIVCFNAIIFTLPWWGLFHFFQGILFLIWGDPHSEKSFCQSDVSILENAGKQGLVEEVLNRVAK